MSRLTAYVCGLVAIDLALFSAIVPLLPHIAARLDLSKLESGILLGSFSASVLVFSVPVGHLADRAGTRTVTIAGSLLMAAATAAFALGGSFPVLVLARVGQGLASAIAWSAGLAWLAERTPAERRGGAIAVANASATGGMIAGPLLGGTVASAVGLRATFLTAAAVSIGLAAWGMTEPGVRAHEEREASLGTALRAAAADELITVSLAVILLVALVGGTLQVLMPLHLGRHGVSQSALGWLYAAGAVLGAVAITLTGRLGDRRGRLPIARVACPALGIAVASLLLPLGTAVFAAVLVALAPMQSVLYGVGYPMGADGADRAGLGHGLVLGMVNLLWGAGAVAGPIAGAGIADAFGDRAAYGTLVVLSFAVGAAILRAAGSPRPARV